MTSMHRGDIVIVGAAETDELGSLPHLSAMELHAEASMAALRDAGLRPSDVDGIAAATPLAYEVSDMLGIRPRWLDGTMVGGSSFLLHVRHAAAAISAGAAEVVLVSHGESGRSRVGAPPWTLDPSSMAGQFEHPLGAVAPYSTHSMIVRAFLDATGMTEADLAGVVVAQREWARPNPRAARRRRVGVQEVLDDVMISSPLTREMCCVVTDGGAAVVLTSAEKARNLPSADRAIHLLGSGEAAESAIISQMDDLTSFGASRRAAAEAFRTAGLAPSDMDHAMLYDAFAHFPLLALEDCGFVERGASGAFVADGRTALGGPLPMNTNGGGLSYTHTGMYGMFAIVESVRQLRGEACVQVPGVERSFVHGIGMMYAAAGALILSTHCT